MDSRTRKIAIWTPVFLAFALVIGILLGVNLQSRRILSVNSRQVNNNNKLGVIMNLIEGNYVDSVDSKKIVESAIPEILKQLDPHSIYIPAKEMQGVSEEMSGNFSGIGVQFSIQNDTIMVIDVVSGGPSQKLGIRAGDRIVTVNDTSMTGKKITNDDVLKKLRGKKGTKVKVGISRKGFRELLPFEITRGEIPINSVDVSYMVNSHIGFVKVGRFGEKTYDEFIKAIDKLERKGAKQLIIDLRGNPGGYLGAVIRMVNEFLDKGELIVYTKGRTQPQRSSYSDSKGNYLGMKIVVLVDEYSASASEIFAGAIQDNDRGTIIGRRTFGKGLVQEQIPFNDGSAVRLTVARYYTPSGRCIQKPYKNGIEDYYADITHRYMHGELEQKDSIHYSDTLKYFTRKGRVVYGGGGIMPDIFVPADTSGITGYYTKITQKGLVYQFAFDYADKNRDELSKLKSGAEFVEFLNRKGVFNEFLQYAAKKGVPEDKPALVASGKIIETQIMAYIARNIIGEEGFYSIIGKIDNTFQEAVKALDTGQLLVKSN
jgi:carboxyl-terminal processing protease